MKFTDGAWMTRDGFSIHKACEVRFIKKDDTKLILTVPTYKIYGKGMTLGGVFLTLEITSPIDNVFNRKAYKTRDECIEGIFNALEELLYK